MKKIFFAKKNNQEAFSLIEVIVSVSLFVIIMLSTTETFRLVVVGQRKAIAAQNVQESLKYFLETTAKEIRMAKKNEGFCGTVAPFNYLGNDDIYAIALAPNGNGQALVFRNFYDECVAYYLGNASSTGRFIVTRNTHSMPISPARVNVSLLSFLVANYNFSGAGEVMRPLVTMRVRAQAYTGVVGSSSFRQLADINMQTSLTSRFYR
ncbi:MAG: prepilin-type N-terminal cleavage/methylation domain-containing protein [Candidatus Falkowbacteria bacterium]|nr:prepilin-type N-terminal cleavage/methylation domain-containing protein [Candidatus Falkowbacteria bacterium]